MCEFRVENRIVDGNNHVIMVYRFLQFKHMEILSRMRNYLLNSFESKTARKVKPKLIGENESC